MALPKHTYQVAGFTYTTPLMTASASLAMLPRIVCLLGQEVTQLVLGTAPTGLETMLANREVVGAMLHTISTNAVAQGDGLLGERLALLRGGAAQRGAEFAHLLQQGLVLGLHHAGHHGPLQFVLVAAGDLLGHLLGLLHERLGLRLGLLAGGLVVGLGDGFRGFGHGLRGLHLGDRSGGRLDLSGGIFVTAGRDGRIGEETGPEQAEADAEEKGQEDGGFVHGESGSVDTTPAQGRSWTRGHRRVHPGGPRDGRRHPCVGRP